MEADGAPQFVKNTRNGKSKNPARYMNYVPASRGLSGPVPRERLRPEAVRALDDFAYFRRRYFGRRSTPWQEEAAYRFVRFLETDLAEWVVINMPPGSGKSTLFCLDIPAWITCRDRGIRGMIGSVSQSLAERYLLRLRNALESPYPPKAETRELQLGLAYDAEATLSGDYGLFKPETPVLWSAHAFIVAQADGRPITEKEPTWSAFGLDSAFIGGRFDVAIWDDVTEDKHLSTADRIDKQRDRWDKIAETRLEPGGVGALQGQRLGPEDLYRHNLDKRIGSSVTQDHTDCCDAEPGRMYHHLVFKAHYEHLCTGDHTQVDYYPKGCLLDPHRLSWRLLEPKLENNSSNFQTVYQQEDVDPARCLVDMLWVKGGTDPATREQYPGCWDQTRDLWEIPTLSLPFVSYMCVDPSPTKNWGITLWVYHPQTQLRFLVALMRSSLMIGQFFDWNDPESKFTGILHDWYQRSVVSGFPLSTLVFEQNAAQRFFLATDALRRWQQQTGVRVIGHETHAGNKLDPNFGPQILSELYRRGLVRLPGGSDKARFTAVKLVEEVTRWPNTRSDDLVMSQWMGEANLGHIYARQPQVRTAWRPTWMPRRDNRVTTSAEQIVELWHQRKTAMGPMMARCDEIRRLYNGDLVLPLPQVDKVEKAAVANLVQQGIDQLGARISSVKPDVDCPSENPGQALADKRARQRRLAILGWWDKSLMTVLDGRRARHLLAYASSPVMIRPGHSHHEDGYPTWHVRSPLQTYPAPRPNPDDMTPDNCIFNYDATLQFLLRRYPDAMAGLEKGPNPRPDDRFDLLEYNDADETVMLVVGKPAQTSNGYGNPAAVGAPLAELMRVPNRAGTCTVVIPKRTSLDINLGKFDGMSGMYQAQARLMALTLLAVERHVFPQEWLVGRPGELPEVLVEADPKNGRTGVVTGGVLQPQELNPSGISMQMVAMLEANQRQQGGLPQEFGGQSPTNVRTGRRGADIMSAQVDFPIQESQTILARSKELENVTAIAVAKGYFGGRTVSFYVRKMKGGDRQVTYRPDDIFTTDVNFVEYPHAGSDANQLAVLIGQLVGLQLISEDTARKLHPLIDDPHYEEEHVTAETLNKALLAAVSAQVQQGTLAAPDVANIIQMITEDRGTLAEAVIKVHQAEQERQAGGPTAPGGAAGAPGLAPTQPGQPAGQGAPPSVNPPSPSEANLAQLLSTLHAPPQQVAGAA